MANDLHLLARIFIRYRSGLSVDLPECIEIVEMFSRAGFDVLNMSNDEILSAVTPHMVTVRESKLQAWDGDTLPVKPRGRRKPSVEEIEPTEDNQESED